jgi:hypothetical protein
MNYEIRKRLNLNGESLVAMAPKPKADLPEPFLRMKGPG